MPVLANSSVNKDWRQAVLKKTADHIAAHGDVLAEMPAHLQQALGKAAGLQEQVQLLVCMLDEGEVASSEFENLRKNAVTARAKAKSRAKSHKLGVQAPVWANVVDANVAA